MSPPRSAPLNSPPLLSHFCAINDKGKFGNMVFVVMTMVGTSLHDLRKVRSRRAHSPSLLRPAASSTSARARPSPSGSRLWRRSRTCTPSATCTATSSPGESSCALRPADARPGPFRNYTVGRPETGELRKLYLLDFGMGEHSGDGGRGSLSPSAHKYVKDVNGQVRLHSAPTDPARPCSARHAQAPLRRRLPRDRPLRRAGGARRPRPVQEGRLLGRRRSLTPQDDVEGWFYTLIELTTGNLPWQASLHPAARALTLRPSRTWTTGSRWASSSATSASTACPSFWEVSPLRGEERSLTHRPLQAAPASTWRS